MKGLINANHTLGEYDVDLSSKSEYVSSKAQIALIDEQLAALNITMAELNSERDQILEDLELLDDTTKNILDRFNAQRDIDFYNDALNEMPEGEERDALESERTELEQQIEDGDNVAELENIESEISAKEEAWEAMEEGDAAAAAEAEIDALRDNAYDIAVPIERIDEINRSLNAQPPGVVKDMYEEMLGKQEAKLIELETEFNDSKFDLEALDLGVDLNGSLELILHAVTKKASFLRDDIEQIEDELTQLALEIANLELRRARVAIQQESEIQVLIRNVWCVDFTEDLSSFIGVINILPITSENTGEEEEDNEAESEALQEEIAILDARIDALAAQIADPEDNETLAALNLLLAAFELRKKKVEADNKYKKQKSFDTINKMVNNGGFQIQPGYENNAKYNSTRDDIPVPDTYRYGIITAIDYDLDTCTVNLGDLVSSV